MTNTIKLKTIIGAVVAACSATAMAQSTEPAYVFKVERQGLEVYPDVEPLSTASLSATSLAWNVLSGITEVGQTTPQAIRLTNTGRKPLTVAEPYLENAATTFSAGYNCPATLAVNEFCDISVLFSPVDMSLSTGNLVVPTGVGSQSIELSGQGFQKLGALTADTSTDYGVVQSGSNATRGFTFTNTGNLPLAGVVARVTGQGMSVPEADNACGTEQAPGLLKPGLTCSFNVSYLPTEGGQTVSGAVSVTSDAANLSSLVVTAQSKAPQPMGQQAFTTKGTYSWVAPAGVTSVSVVAVGGGGGGGANLPGGGGGGLGWKNNIPVEPGKSYTVVVGAGGLSYNNNGLGGTSYFISTATVAGYGGGLSAGGGFVGDGGGKGGNGNNISGRTGPGGGAGGYSGNGGNGFSAGGTAGQGGGGGGGAKGSSYIGGGGGVGIMGQGANGAGGTSSGAGWGAPGGAGSGGSVGSPTASNGGVYGGGGLTGGGGAVRIIWGDNRAFPATNTGDL